MCLGAGGSTIEGRRVEHLEHPAGRTRRLLGERQQPAQRDDRPDQPQVEGEERDQLADAQRAVRDRQHPAERHAGEDQLRLSLEQRPEPGQRVDLRQFGLLQHGGVAAERVEHLRTSAVGLDHPDTERGFLDGRGQVSGEVLGPAGIPAVAQLEAAGEDDKRSHCRPGRTARSRTGSTATAEHDQGGGRVRDQEDEAESDETADRRQIGGRPRQQLAGRPAVVEGDRQPLQVAEQVTADVRLDAEGGAGHRVAGARRTAPPRPRRGRARGRRAARGARCRDGGSARR